MFVYQVSGGKVGLFEILSARIRRRMPLRRTYLLMVIIIYPYIVGYTADPDSAGSSGFLIEMLAGYGQFADVKRDCYGKPVGKSVYASSELGTSAQYQLSKTVRVGVRGGAYLLNRTETDIRYNFDNQTEKIVWFYNPYIGIEAKGVAFYYGLVYFTEDIYDLTGETGNNLFMLPARLQPTWTLRVGNREKFHFTTQYLSSLPLMSGSGIFDLGFGFGSTSSRNVTWFGSSMGPYQAFGLVVKQNIQLSESLDLLLRGRAGSNEKTFEGSIAAGVRMAL